MQRLKKIFVAVTLSTVAISVQSAVVDDQSQFYHNGGSGITSDTYIQEAAQTFTVGVNGVLDAIELSLTNHQGSTANLDYNIYAVEDGVIIDIPLFSGTIDTSVIPSSVSWPTERSEFTKIDLSVHGLQVAIGEQYAFSLTSTEHYGLSIGANASNPYPGGAMYSRNDIGSNPTWEFLQWPPDSETNSYDWVFVTTVDEPDNQVMLKSSSINPYNFGVNGQISDFTGAHAPLTRAYTYFNYFSSTTNVQRIEFTGTSFPYDDPDLRPLFEVAFYTGEAPGVSQYPLGDLVAVRYVEADFEPSSIISIPGPNEADNYTIEFDSDIVLPAGENYWVSVTYIGPELLAIDPTSDFVWEWKRANGLNPFTLSFDLFAGVLTALSGELELRAYGSTSE